MKESYRKDRIDPELVKRAHTWPLTRCVVAAGNIYQELTWRGAKAPAGMEEGLLVTKGYRGLPLKTAVFSPKGVRSPMPALIYVHGGAFVYKASVHQKKHALLYAKKAGCRVFFPHFHLAPKYPYPAAYEDVLSLCRYVAGHADALGVDAARIGLAGNSAGASIAALVCSRWEAEGIRRPCLQMLLYPVTDAGMETESMKCYTDTPQWNSRLNQRMWRWYCGRDPGLRYRASPMHSPLPSVIPKTYLETAQFDCLHDEGLLYGEKLKKAGADVVINDTRGTYHAYDGQMNAGVVRQAMKRRIAFLKRGFAAR